MVALHGSGVRETFGQLLRHVSGEQAQIYSSNNNRCAIIQFRNRFRFIELSIFNGNYTTNFFALVLFGKSTTTPPVKPARIDCCVMSSSYP